MTARFWLSGFIMAIVSLVLDFLVHGVLLRAGYAELPQLYRPPADAQRYFGFMLAAHALIGFGMTWIYRQGVVPGRGPLGQGVRFGIAVAVMVTIPIYLIYYAVQPLPGALVAKQVIFDTVATVLMGVLVAALNRAGRP
ncbi:MAG: hypothetical protein ACREKQ_03505 [Candidatus Rokuibacteriota bacterium]